MTKRNQVCSSLRGHDSGDARDLEGVSLGILWKLHQHFRLHSEEPVRPGSPLAGLLAGYIHHARTACSIEVREFTHFKSTWIISPAAHDSRFASAMRNPLARQNDTISFEPLHGTGVTSPHSILAGRNRISPGRCLKSWVSLAMGIGREDVRQPLTRSI